ncbi:MAG: polyphenol oxidase family protein [candidate division Zixibacteria bacterium]|jgi:YfiH family protein|nr:polyphenol oxidase family protein [candidate division Zixibacteria bacterium]
MIDRLLIKTFKDNIRWIDLTDILGTPAGIIIRNDHLLENDLQKKIVDISNSQSSTIKIYRPIQKHTNRIVASTENLDIPADGIYSQSPNHLLVIRTADCIPLFIYDGRTAAVLHLGWRGIIGGIVANIKRTISQFNCADAKAVIGPGIGRCCFEVSPEVALIFDSEYRIFNDRKYYIDLETMVIDEMKKQGFRQIHSLNACTFCESDLFYSYRREGEDVRHLLSFIRAGG